MGFELLTACYLTSFIPCHCACGVYYPLNCSLHMSQVFLDELNASTCGGLFKEVIIDKSFEGEVTEMLTSLVYFLT